MLALGHLAPLVALHVGAQLDCTAGRAQQGLMGPDRVLDDVVALRNGQKLWLEGWVGS